MRFLVGNVLLDSIEVGLADGEIGVSALPFEIGKFVVAFLEPEIGDAFQFLDPFSLGDGAGESREQVDVIFHAADEESRAIELFGSAAEIFVERVADRFVAQEWAPVFGGENEVDVNRGEGLGHGAVQDDQPRHPLPIPKGLRPPAQGCEARATLGFGSEGISTATRLWQSLAGSSAYDVGRNRVAVGALRGRGPRVARASQPWAGGRSPVGAGRWRCLWQFSTQ